MGRVDEFGSVGGYLAGVDRSGRGYNPRPERSTHARALERRGKWEGLGKGGGDEFGIAGGYLAGGSVPGV